MSGSPKVAKRNIYFISKWLFFLVMFPWTPRLQFWPACRNCFLKNPKCFRSKSEKQKKCCFFLRKKSFLQTFRWTLGMHFWQPSQNVLPKVRIFFDENEKKLFSLKMFPWTPILHFWQACQKNSAKTWKSSCRKSRILLKRFFSERRIIKIFLSRRKRQFWQCFWEFFAKSWLFLLLIVRIWQREH